MEKEPKKPEERRDDEESEDEDNSINLTYSKNSQEKKSEEKSKLAKFFESKQISEPEEKSKQRIDDKPDEKSESLDPEESGNLTESEVHEVVLTVVDTRIQEVEDELEAATTDSKEEYTALSSAIFLDAVASRAGSDEDITVDDIEAAYGETVEDITLAEDDHDMSSEDAEPPNNESEPPGLEDFPNSPDNTPRLSPPVPTTTGFETVPVATSSKSEVPDEYEAYIPRSDMLLGLVVGYIIGRRGGRIRTEKRLKPEIKKLENQVAELIEVIIQKEKLIRKQSQEIYEKSFSVADKTNAVIERRKVRVQVNEQLKQREKLLNDPGVEKIGKFSLPALKVFHERRLPDGNENSPKRVQVEVMNTQQLLEKVDNLKIDSISVVSMFNRSKLSLEGLRQIVKEYLRGGEFKKTFYKELQPDPEEIKSQRSRIEQNQSKETLQIMQAGDTKHEVNSNKSNLAENQNQNTKFSQTKKPNKINITPIMITAIVFITLVLTFLLLN